MDNETIEEQDLEHFFLYRTRLGALQCRDCEYVADDSNRDSEVCPAMLQGLGEWGWQDD